MPQFGEILRNLRLQRGLGIKKLSPDLGISSSHLSRLENGLAQPSDPLVSRVANYFEYNETALLLSASRIPPEIMRQLQVNPEEAVQFLLDRFGTGRDDTTAREPASARRSSRRA
jgi:transcriptional regulator with XRE-family HTH domain